MSDRNRISVLALVAAWCLSTGLADAQGLIGGLYVATDPPGAAVYVDGELKGVSPCGVPDVGVGEVDVKAVLQGYADAQETVEVKADQTTRVDLPLRRLGNVGSIAVLVEPPGSTVHVDRVPAGRTPVVVLNVRAGTHNVTVSSPGYQPHYATATVTAGRQAAIAGKLKPGQAAAAAAEAEDLDTLGVLDEDDVPALSELEEGRAFAQVRDLLTTRRYAAALERLDAMAADPELRRYSQRIGRERRFTRRLQELVAAAHRELASATGSEFVLSLRKGVRLSGKLLEVTDEHVRISVSGRDVKRPLADLAASQIIRLASRRFDPSRAANQITFALLYAADGEFEPAYERLRQAAGSGQAIASARSYLDAEHLWEEAVRKDARERARARAAGTTAAAHVLESGPPVPLLIDTYRGRAPPSGAETLLRNTGLTVRRLEASFSPEDAAQPGVLLICDPGGSSPVAAYGRQEAQRIVDFVRRGGGLIFVGARRPVPDESTPGVVHPFAPLLRWCGIAVRLDELSVADEAPEEYPEQFALSFPAVRHPVVQGVGRVAFPIASPSLGLQEASWGIVRTSPLVGSKAAREAAPAVVAARVLGMGRVVVLASWPTLDQSAWQGSGVHENDAATLLRSAAQWVAYPSRKALAGGDDGM